MLVLNPEGFKGSVDPKPQSVAKFSLNKEIRGRLCFS